MIVLDPVPNADYLDVMTTVSNTGDEILGILEILNGSELLPALWTLRTISTQVQAQARTWGYVR